MSSVSIFSKLKLTGKESFNFNCKSYLSFINGNAHCSWIRTTTPYLRTLPLVLCCKLFTWYMYQHLPVGTCINTYLYKILLSFWQIEWMPPHLGTKSTNMQMIWTFIIEIHFKHPVFQLIHVHCSFQFKSIETKSYIKENQWPDSIGQVYSSAVWTDIGYFRFLIKCEESI